jgi:hypothetical protein
MWLGFETVRNEAEGGISQLYALIFVIAIILALYGWRRVGARAAPRDSV